MKKIYPLSFRFDSQTIQRLKAIQKVLNASKTTSNIGVIRFLVNRYYEGLVDAGVIDEKEVDNDNV